MFDWPRFLEVNHIEYVERGPNVSRNNIAIRCPFCADDPSQHMMISLEGAGWVCWRDRARHKGRSPVKLIQALLKCSWERAQTIAGVSISIPTDLTSRIKSMLAKPVVPPQHKLELPEQFKALSRARASHKIFVDYLRRRNFSNDTIDSLHNQYGIHVATQGEYKGRIIFPVAHQSRLITWTGRTVYDGILPRYKSLSREDDITPAIGRISDYLLWYDQLIKSYANTFYLVEGPFDALKINTLAAECKIKAIATCMFTNTLSQSQIGLLHDVIPKFRHRFILLDQGALAKALNASSALKSLRMSVKSLPDAISDPGELDIESFIYLNQK